MKGAEGKNLEIVKTLRLILGDQLNTNHSWFQERSPHITYVMMEVRSETDYVTHHVQKVLGFFAAMRLFAENMSSKGHHFIYLRIRDPRNLQSIDANCKWLIHEHGFEKFEYLLPDEFRLDKMLSNFALECGIPAVAFDSEHFLTERFELRKFFTGKKQYLMESFYRMMRAKHGILMDGDQPLFNQWNFDHDNRKKLPAGHQVIAPHIENHNLNQLLQEMDEAGIVTIGHVDANHFIWPLERNEALSLLDFFLQHGLPQFGTFQDAMSPHHWSLYHSRLSFALNTKMLSPLEVIERSIEAYHGADGAIAYHQLEGFVRQILGWREYMRGMYWHTMPQFSTLNFFDHHRKLPSWFWSGKTKMSCLRHAITQSLQFAYAHHIQRLMVTGNFMLLSGIHPDDADRWYLGIYIDALEWVEITNTRGMSQYADGGLIATKPYVSSAAYIDKMGHYCGNCFYDKNKKMGERACPFNSLYWNFLAVNESSLKNNARMSMMYRVWHKMDDQSKQQIRHQAEIYLERLDEL